MVDEIFMRKMKERRKEENRQTDRQTAVQRFGNGASPRMHNDGIQDPHLHSEIREIDEP